MYGINKVILLGTVGGEPKHNTSGGNDVSMFRLVTNTTHKTKDGEKKEDSTWHSVICWGGLSAVCKKKVSKGTGVYVEGRIRVNEKGEGEDKIRYFDIIADELVIVNKPIDKDWNTIEHD